jgi:HSP20 family molecular chaperone IbpA
MALPVRVERGRAASDPYEMVRHDFGNMLGRFFGGGGLFGDPDGLIAPLASLANYGVDIREDADHVYIEADLPGFRKEEIDISLENGTLTITAEHTEEIEEPAPGNGGDGNRQGQQAQGQQQGQPAQQERRARGRGRGRQQDRASDEGTYLLRERVVRRFQRSFTLPPNVDESDVQARYDNGVLRITLNKLEESKPKHIQVS